VSENQLCFLEVFRRLLLQIGGANIAVAVSHVLAAYLVVARGRKKRVPSFRFTLLAPLAEAGAR
jgi:hypothetical protein